MGLTNLIDLPAPVIGFLFLVRVTFSIAKSITMFLPLVLLETLHCLFFCSCLVVHLFVLDGTRCIHKIDPSQHTPCEMSHPSRTCNRIAGVGFLSNQLSSPILLLIQGYNSIVSIVPNWALSKYLCF